MTREDKIVQATNLFDEGMDELDWAKKYIRQKKHGFASDYIDMGISKLAEAEALFEEVYELDGCPVEGR